MGLKHAWRGLWSDTEHRADQDLTNYTDQVIGRMLSDSEGSRIRPDALATVETAVQLYESVFSSATVEPLDQRTQAITPTVLALTGRSLARTGNALFRFDIQRGRNLELIPVTSFLIQGGAHPSEWRYSVNLSGPSEIRTQHDVPAQGVIHFRLKASPDSAWMGRSPISIASGTSKLAAKIESALIKEESFPPARMVFSDLLDEDLTNFITDLRRGGLSVVGGSDDQSGPTPSTRSPQAIGPDPSVSQVSLRTETASSILAMYGIPSGLFSGSGDSDSRESWRRFVIGTMAPAIRVCQAELRIKLDRPELTLSLESLRAGDLQGRARATAARALAMRNLVTAGLSVEDAREAAGI